jgi:DNA-binding XRE family transcriptional regulator
MDEGILRYAPPDEVVRLAKEAGLTTAQIVRIVSGCLTYREALKVAQDYAPLLEISVSEFMELRKNE